LSRLIENVKVKRIRVLPDRIQNNPGRPPTQTLRFKRFIDLPTYVLVEIKGQGNAERWDILVPDDEAEEIGNSGKFRLVKDKIKKKYRGQKWDNDDPLDIEIE